MSETLAQGGTKEGSKTWLGLVQGFRLVGRQLHPRLWMVLCQDLHKLVWWNFFSILTGSRLIASGLQCGGLISVCKRGHEKGATVHTEV